MLTPPPSETLLDTYLQPWKKYVQFSGRASRREYWTFTLINAGIYLALVIVSAIAGGGDPSGNPNPVGLLFQIAYTVFYLATLIPGLAVAVRRLHDTNRSGWWLIPCIICGIILLVFGLQEGDHGPNQYGPDPYDPEHREPWSLTPPPPSAYSDFTSGRPAEMWRTDDKE